MKIKNLLDLPHTRSYLTRVGAEPRSLKAAVVKEIHGSYWKDLGIIRFTKAGVITCTNVEHSPTDREVQDIAAEFATVQWPELKPLSRLVNPPPEIAEADPKKVFIFRNEEGLIVLVHLRVADDQGKYRPWTYWDDGEWRMCEPDGPLPLYNAHLLKDAGVVFIHEGAKAAHHIQWLIEQKTPEAKKAFIEHPWGQELSGAVHIGWIGGALSPYRTDWSILKKAGIKRAYIVADNDEPGRSAVPAISQQINMVTFSVQFTDEFPSSFDLADPFPDSMFGKILDSGRHYIGPQFRDCLHPATWATNLIPNPKGKPTPVLRDSFRNMWAYIEEADIFVCTEMPDIIRSEAILNKHLAAFSHVAETSRLIVKAYRGRAARICYRPDHEGLMVTFQGSSAINLHIPSSIKPGQGSPDPWLEYLNYMFVNKAERKEVERWCATLIARPDIRMGYGLLLISERQGIGKTTLGAHILAPLVGVQNVGYPSENDIVSSFNAWMAGKRLVIVNEIYSGSSWKAYNSLKSVITDRDIEVNQKYIRQYKIENWCHVLACSNSLRALKMENDDRRWYYPEITEIPWPKNKFIEFRKWVEQGGLGIIKKWAMDYNDYVAPSDRAPMTERKTDMIEGSRSDAQKEASALAALLNDKKEPAALLMKEIIGWVKHAVEGRVFDNDFELRRAMIETGAYCWPKRIKCAGHPQYVIMNETLRDKVSRVDEPEALVLIRESIVKPQELMAESM